MARSRLTDRNVFNRLPGTAMLDQELARQLLEHAGWEQIVASLPLSPDVRHSIFSAYHEFQGLPELADYIYQTVFY